MPRQSWPRKYAPAAGQVGRLLRNVIYNNGPITISAFNIFRANYWGETKIRPRKRARVILLLLSTSLLRASSSWPISLPTDRVDRYRVVFRTLEISTLTKWNLARRGGFYTSTVMASDNTNTNGPAAQRSLGGVTSRKCVPACRKVAYRCRC